jgi:hypothetical protein
MPTDALLTLGMLKLTSLIVTGGPQVAVIQEVGLINRPFQQRLSATKVWYAQQRKRVGFAGMGKGMRGYRRALNCQRC